MIKRKSVFILVFFFLWVADAYNKVSLETTYTFKSSLAYNILFGVLKNKNQAFLLQKTRYILVQVKVQNIDSKLVNMIKIVLEFFPSL